MRQQLQADAAGRTGGGPGAEAVVPDDYRAALALVADAQAREQVRSSGQQKFDPAPTGRRGGADVPQTLDDRAFVSSDPIIFLTGPADTLTFNAASPAARPNNDKYDDDHHSAP